MLLNECNSRMNGYVTLLSYRYMNLPIKAEPASLLPVKVIISDGEVDLEHVALVTLDNERSFVVYPKEQRYMDNIRAGIKLQHPEFKQELRHMEESEADEDEVLVLTMPDVDDDRYKVLTEAVKNLNEDCTSRLDVTFSTYAAKLAADLFNAENSTREEASKMLDDLKKKFSTQQKMYTENKLKEIEDAHEAYQKNASESDKLHYEDEQTDKVFNMKMN